MKNTTRKVDLIEDDEFAGAVRSATSYSNLLRSLELGVSSSAIGYAKDRVSRDGLDDRHLDANAKKPVDEQLGLNEELEYRISTYALRRCLFSAGRKYCCSDCGNTGMWNGIPLTLDVHHKNSNWRDNRLENLDFLCPNCHSIHTRKLDKSQATADYKNVSTITYGTCACGNSLNSTRTQYCSLSCHGKDRFAVDWNNINLVSMVESEGMNLNRASKLLKVRYKTVKKWYTRQKADQENLKPT